MLDSPPCEPEWRSWVWVCLAVGVIYATIPLTRALVEMVDRQLGREVFLYLCLALFAVGGSSAWRNMRQRHLPRAAYLSLLAVMAVFTITIYRLREIPEEALHLVQYGLLAILGYRALVHRVRDYTIYPLALLLTAVVGMVDEYIQWVVPSRYYDLSDIKINVFAGLLAQVGLVTGLRPRLVAHFTPGASWRRLGYGIAAALVVLLVSFVNTPERVVWYAKRVPGLEFLLNGDSMMAQYGYLHRSADQVAFRSRFDVDALAALDRQRGAEVARILNRDFGKLRTRS